MLNQIATDLAQTGPAIHVAAQPVTLSVRQSRLCIDVEDTGPGSPEDALEQVV